LIEWEKLFFLLKFEEINNPRIKIVIPAVAERRAGIQKSFAINGFPHRGNDRMVEIRGPI
jgi:hypothetical protein